MKYNVQPYNYGLFEAERALLAVVDIQERLMPVIWEQERVINNACMLLQGASILQIPAFITEQYPKGLGSSVPAIIKAQSTPCVLEKVSFSIFGDEAITQHINMHNPKHLIICGVESHVCVLQSVLHARACGLCVWVVADALSSRTQNNHNNALHLMAQVGAHITNTESILFGAMHNAKHAGFKAISALIK